MYKRWQVIINIGGECTVSMTVYNNSNFIFQYIISSSLNFHTHSSQTNVNEIFLFREYIKSIEYVS